MDNSPKTQANKLECNLVLAVARTCRGHLVLLLAMGFFHLRHLLSFFSFFEGFDLGSLLVFSLGTAELALGDSSMGSSIGASLLFCDEPKKPVVSSNASTTFRLISSSGLSG